MLWNILQGRLINLSYTHVCDLVNYLLPHLYYKPFEDKEIMKFLFLRQGGYCPDQALMTNMTS